MDVKESYLCSSCSVLCCSTRDQFCITVQKLFVDAEVLFFGENGIVGFEAILGEQGSVTEGIISINWKNNASYRLSVLLFSRDIQEGILQRQQFVVTSSHCAFWYSTLFKCTETAVSSAIWKR
jgi:hypothetical protein